MKKSYIITAILLVLLSFAGQAQKSQEDLRIPYLKTEKKHSVVKNKQAFDAEKEIYRRQAGDDVHVRRIEFDTPGKLKSALVLPVEQMDSLVDFDYDTLSMSWNLNYTDWFEYDSLGRNTKDAYFGSQSDTTYPDYGGAWEIGWDANGGFSEELEYDWTDSTGFFPYYWYQYFYDSNGNQIAGYGREWNDVTQSWVPDDTDTITYDGMDNKVESVDYDYDTMLMIWIPEYRRIWEYDSVGKRTFHNGFNWNPDSSDWEVNSRTEFFYDQNGRDTTRIESFWDGFSWYPDRKKFIKYNASGARTILGYYNWDGELLEWYGSSKEEYTLDANDRVTEQLDSYWDYIKSDWYINRKSTYSRDGNGNVTEDTEFYYDTAQMVFIPYRKAIYEYDLGVSWSDIALPLEFTDTGYLEADDRYIWSFYNKVLNSYELEYNTTAMSWDSTYYEQFYYSPFGGGTQPVTCRADFSYGTGDDPLEISFVDSSSTNTGVWSWNFGDETYSTLSDPMHKYDAPGTYSVSLTVADSTQACGHTIIKLIKVGTECDANFDFIPETDPLQITFMDASGGDVTSWYWTFGDGFSSTLSDPTHTYMYPGTYKISLSTTDSTGDCSNTILKQIKVGNTLCSAEFSMAVDTAGKIITLTNLSQGTNLMYHWSFGDGEVSKAMSPVHTYQFAGSYDVSLTIQRDSSCMDRYSLNTIVGTGICRADFDVFVDSAAITASFSAKNQNLVNLYRWEFGDGSIATTPDVTKTFTHPGYYSARLTVSNNTAECVNSQKVTILVGSRSPGGKADFIYVSGDGNKVKFNNRSLGEPLTYVWDFNDGTTSMEMHPENEYALPGYYNVCLTVSTADGNRNTYCETIFAGTETTNECLAQFEYQLSENQLAIACFDRSLGSPDTWNWTYNDGVSDTDQNPTWSTSTPKYVKIQQTIMNSSNECRDDAFGLVNMGAEGKLKAGIGYIIDTTNKKADTYPVDFVGVSLGDAGKLKWDFGDGTADSTSINPVHVYTRPGTYEVCLTITNTTTGEEDKSCESVSVGGGEPSSSEDLLNLEMGLKSYPNPFNENATIEFFLLNESEIDLSVYDLMGRKVASIAREYRQAGTHTFSFAGSDLEAGNYYLILKSNNGVARTVMSVIR